MKTETLLKKEVKLGKKLGIGVAWIDSPEYLRFINSELDPLYHYIEVHLPSNIQNVPSNFEKIAHCSTLPLADIHEPTKDLIKDVFQQAKEIKAHWIGEHLSILGTTYGLQFGYIFAPIKDEDLKNRVIKRIKRYQETYGIPFVIELGPRYHDWGGVDVLEDYKLLKSISNEANIPIILDIPHTWATAKAFNKSFEDLLSLLKGAHIAEIHIGASGVSKKGQISFEQSWNQLVICLEMFPDVRGITVELGKNTKIEDYCNTVREVSKRFQSSKWRINNESN
ncbi:multinuclear nonheme iron-dependent oxidase [Peribacillus simplex]|uniref:multinuclear nonheme iron-dependent oxidase n=1 Tax=Peribacillus simplex TaxID=1478 RepID=UPI003D2D7EE0